MTARILDNVRRMSSLTAWANAERTSGPPSAAPLHFTARPTPDTTAGMVDLRARLVEERAHFIMRHEQARAAKDALRRRVNSAGAVEAEDLEVHH